MYRQERCIRAQEYETTATFCDLLNMRILCDLLLNTGIDVTPLALIKFVNDLVFFVNSEVTPSMILDYDAIDP